jgi:hypothetical protein
MLSEAAVADGIAGAEKRLDAMEVLCGILVGQVKGERHQLQELRRVLASPHGQKERDGGGQGEIGPEMLG